MVLDKMEKLITGARRYLMRPRGIVQALDRIDTIHLEAPSAFEYHSLAVRVVVLEHDQPGIVNADRRAFNHDALGWRV